MYKGKNIKLTVATTFEEAFNRFQSYNEARNITDKSIYNYEYAKKAFATYMGDDFSLSDITSEKIEAYIKFCRSRGNSPITINTKLRHLRAMFNFFYDRGYMDKVYIKLLKADKPVKEVYTDEELRILLKKPNMRTSGFDDYRNWVMINYLLATGNRLSSLQNIKVKDVNLDEYEITLRHTKNRTQQIIPIASVLRGILIEYLQIRKPATGEDYLFCTWHGKQLTYGGIRNGIKRYNERRGITKTSIHLFRHTFAKKWIMNRGDILRLQKLLGHKTLDMVKEYVHLFGADLHKDYDKFNPLSSMHLKKHIKL